MKTQINLTQEEQVQAAIEKGKKKFGKVYKTVIADEPIIWRKLKRGEYKEIMNIVLYKEAPKLDDDGNEVLDELGNVIMEQVFDDEATYDVRQEEIAKAVILFPNKDIVEDMAAEQKARTTYDNILRVVDDPDVADPIRFLRQREVVHFQRFGEGLRRVQEDLDPKNFYQFNPGFDRCMK